MTGLVSDRGLTLQSCCVGSGAAPSMGDWRAARIGGERMMRRNARSGGSQGGGREGEMAAARGGAMEERMYTRVVDSVSVIVLAPADVAKRIDAIEHPIHITFAIGKAARQLRAVGCLRG
jgi:hypothetical protein